MGVLGGIASGQHGGAPEMAAVFLCESQAETEFFVDFASKALLEVRRTEAPHVRRQPVGPTQLSGSLAICI